MTIEMLMPQLGESITEATVLKWRKSVGDRVEKDEPIVEISTDKVDSEIPAPEAGVIVAILVEEGATVPIKSPILVIDTEAAIGSPSVTGAQAPKSQPAIAQPVKADRKEEKKVEVLPAAAESTPLDDRAYSPLVRNLAEQYHLSSSDLASIGGTGPQGRVTKTDLLEYIALRGVDDVAKSSPRSASSVEEKAIRPQYDENGLRREPMDRMRQIIAEHMVRSKATSPHVYTIAEVDVSGVAAWREKNQSAFVAREGFKLSFTPFFLEAVTRSLMKFPQINASVEGTDLVMKRDINLGCAVSLGNTGLIVPVIKQADQLNLAGLARSLNDVAERARRKALAPNDIQGGTFTVTNLGTFGNIIGCPIISQPQLGILGIGAIKKRPVVVNNMIAIRDIAYLTLSYDHRVIDGSLAGQFLQSITKYIEGWDQARSV